LTGLETESELGFSDFGANRSNVNAAPWTTLRAMSRGLADRVRGMTKLGYRERIVENFGNMRK